jgi:hypothetical protein
MQVKAVSKVTGCIRISMLACLPKFYLSVGYAKQVGGWWDRLYSLFHNPVARDSCRSKQGWELGGY